MFGGKSFPLVLAFVAIGCLLSSCTSSNSSTEVASENTETGTLASDFPTVAGEQNDEPVNQIELARRRVALRSVIRKGDYYQARNDAEKAIAYYKGAYSKIGNDPSLMLRLANAYYELRQFREAADLFAKTDIARFDEPSKKKVIASFMLDAERADRLAEVSKLPFLPGTKEYLAVVDQCIQKPETCTESIQKSTSKDPQVEALKSIVVNSTQTSSDVLYTSALIAGKLFEQKAFLASAKLSEHILSRRPDYRIMLKIGGYSKYELGDYTGSAALLENYYAREPKDIETAYMLGIVNYFKDDFATSNLYFNAAVLGGYEPKTELERRLIYNYTLLGDSISAFKIFRYLLDEKDVTAEDFEIALFMANEAGEYSKASAWSKKGLAKFPDNSRILAFAGGSKRRSGDLEEAEALLRRAIQTDANNAVALLELGRLFIDKNLYDVAQTYLENTIGSDKEGYFAEEAQKLLDELPKPTPVAEPTPAVAPPPAEIIFETP